MWVVNLHTTEGPVKSGWSTKTVGHLDPCIRIQTHNPPTLAPSLSLSLSQSPPTLCDVLPSTLHSFIQILSRPLDRVYSSEELLEQILLQKPVTVNTQQLIYYLMQICCKCWTFNPVCECVCVFRRRNSHTRAAAVAVESDFQLHQPQLYLHLHHEERLLLHVHVWNPRRSSPGHGNRPVLVRCFPELDPQQAEEGKSHLNSSRVY